VAPEVSPLRPPEPANADHEIRVRRPTVKRAGRHQFVSGKTRQNAMKALVVTDARGRILFGGATCRGSTADITQAHQVGFASWLEHTTAVEILPDAGYQGLGAQTFGQVLTPTQRHHKKRLERMPGIADIRAAQRKAAHARRRVRVEHGIAHLKNWRSLARHFGRREILDDTVRAVAGLLCDHQHTERPHHQPIAALTAPAR
jgi:hypothetical protein